MSKSQRDKGANAEREVAKIIQAHGFRARRGQVFNHEPDIVTDMPFHIEVKRQEKTELGKWFMQSQEAAKGKIPIVVHRKSREPWMVTMRFEEWLDNICPHYEGDFADIEEIAEDDLPFF